MDKWKIAFFITLLAIFAIGATAFQKFIFTPVSNAGFYQVSVPTTTATAINSERPTKVFSEVLNPTNYFIVFATYSVTQAELTGSGKNYWVLYPSSTVQGNKYDEITEPYTGVLYAISSGNAEGAQIIQVRERWR